MGLASSFQQSPTEKAHRTHSKAMKALVYRNTRSPVRGWESVHESQARGYAYETNDHFVHIYGAADRLWTISNGLTVSVKKDGELIDWVQNEFGAQNVEESDIEVGTTIEGVWRPGLYYDEEMLQGLAETNVDLRLAEQSLLLLIERLDELLLFIEPTAQTITTYGHKTRELLILACTEIEAYWLYYLNYANISSKKSHFTTIDYVKLRDPLHLEEYEVTLPRYTDIDPIRPFLQWSTKPGPTQTLPWYAAYNGTKHDPKGQFSAATILACIQAIAANIVMFSVRFGPYRLYNGGGMLSALFKPSFEISLTDCDPKSFYVPDLDLTDRGPALTWGRANALNRRTTPFKV